MTTKDVLRDLYLQISNGNSVRELMATFEKVESQHNITPIFLFVSDLPEDDSASYLSVVDENGEEWSNDDLNKAAVAFSIRTGMTYKHRDLLLAYAEWVNTSSPHLQAFKRSVEDNSLDQENAAKMLDVLTRVAPSLSIVK